MPDYPFRNIEKKWQKYWKTHATFKCIEDTSYPKEKRMYVLDMFPYPSSAGLHVGHPLGYTATDIYCRYFRMKGYNVLHPIGWDSFGLPAETYAIQTGTHPRVTSEKNIQTFRSQIESLGFSYDWDREIATHTSEYYQWTQWIFLQLYKKNLVYQADIPVWYCDQLGTVLANEEVILTDKGPRSERGNHPVSRRLLTQWMLRITEYAERLTQGLSSLDWPDSIKSMQRNWIGRKEGASITFYSEKDSHPIEVFTTRPDTVFGTTYLVLAPEHPLVSSLTTSTEKKQVEIYIHNTSLKSDIERTDLLKEKTGVFTGSYARNPATEKIIPIWIADYVLYHYGTGAIMAVPAHDERDWDFARVYNIPIIPVIKTTTNNNSPTVYTGEGTLINSQQFDGYHSQEARKAITTWLSKKKAGKWSVQYKMRDWVFSRQRYWGEPIPLMFDNNENIIPLSEKDLPLTLPEIENYQPSHNGLSPLASIHEWVHIHYQGQSVRRETHTMPQWAGSCWYYLRFLDPHNKESLACKEAIQYWMPVDLYVGGSEHAVLHLLYARFWHMVLYDLNIVNTEEPFQRLVNQGMILGEGGVKMSKSLGNVINPDTVIADYGADSLRMYEMFMGPLQSEKPWDTKGIHGIARFLDRVWQKSYHVTKEDICTSADFQRILHYTIQKVEHDIETLSFNTAISQLMICLNTFLELETIPQDAWEIFLLLLSPFAPHICEELWERLGNNQSISKHKWPVYDAQKLKKDTEIIVIQINGKRRAHITVSTDVSNATIEQQARSQKRIIPYLENKQIKKIIVVPHKIINFVI